LTLALLHEEVQMLPIHVLAAIVVLLVLYLFYAVINPEKF
jgi:K+-transporting ATPase KdpF subunit